MLPDHLKRYQVLTGSSRRSRAWLALCLPIMAALAAFQLHPDCACCDTPATLPNEARTSTAVESEATSAGISPAASGGGRAMSTSLTALIHSLATRDTLTGNWFGVRSAMESHGITPALTLLQAASENFSGGIRTNRIDWRYRLDASLTFDTQQLCGWKGGTGFVDFMAHGGQNPANDLVGALQAISAIDQNPATRLDQIWYKQAFLDGHLWFKLGRIDATYDLDHIRDGQPFLNGSFGFTPAIFVFPSYPFSAWGGEYSWSPLGAITLRGGLFDGNTENTVPNVASTDPNAIENPFGILAITEESLNWHLGPGHLWGTMTFGQWYHTGTFNTYTGSQVHGTGGFYGYLDQTLWKAAPAKTQTASRVGGFLHYAWANSRLTEIDQNISGGLRWRAPIPGRDDDNIGIAATWAHLSRYAQTPHSYELAIEGFYSAQITPWLNIQPDLQYIINPGGTYQNALVATVQVAIQF